MMWPEKIIFLFKDRWYLWYTYQSQPALDLELKKWLLASRPPFRQQRGDRFFFFYCSVAMAVHSYSLWFLQCSATFELLMEAVLRASSTNPVWCIWIILSLTRHSRNSLNTSWQCFRGSAELTSHLTQKSVSYSRRNRSYNGESAKKCDHWPREVECNAGLTYTGKHVHKGTSLGFVHTIRGSQV